MSPPRIKILVIDDDRLLRWSLGQKLASWDFDFSEADTGEAGPSGFGDRGPVQDGRAVA